MVLKSTPRFAKQPASRMPNILKGTKFSTIDFDRKSRVPPTPPAVSTETQTSGWTLLFTEGFDQGEPPAYTLSFTEGFDS